MLFFNCIAYLIASLASSSNEPPYPSFPYQASSSEIVNNHISIRQIKSEERIKGNMDTLALYDILIDILIV